MSEKILYIPFSRSLYNDIVRFSDGQLDPTVLAENLVVNWIENSLESGGSEWSGERLEEVAEKYAPHVLVRWREEDAAKLKERHDDYRPLVWKEVSVASGSEVRMFYGDQHHYAKIKRGKILDDGKEYSPSEWASKVADGTSRNAWRDIWFREPQAKTWVPAQLLREQAREEMTRTSHSSHPSKE